MGWCAEVHPTVAAIDCLAQRYTVRRRGRLWCAVGKDKARKVQVVVDEPDPDWAEMERAIGILSGARLTSVQFVLDYLILGFDEKGALTMLVWPVLNPFGGDQTCFGDRDYRNALCSLIERTVVSLAIETADTISIEFDNRTEIRIPLGASEGAGERAILTGPHKFLYVF